jgi:hypothetical protein
LNTGHHLPIRIGVCVLGLLCTLSVSAQRKRFSWQGYCFDHPAAPFCRGHEYAVKKHPPGQNGEPQGGDTGEFTPTPTVETPSIIVIPGGIDWRFADPAGETLAGFHFKHLSTSPFASRWIAQLGARQGLGEADTQKILSRLQGMDQLALSVRDGKMVAMLTGPLASQTPPALDPALKAATVSGGALLIGHAEAVDQALQRIAAQGPPSESTRLAYELHAGKDLWAIAPARLAGDEAVNAGVQQFLVSLFIGNGIASDVAFECSHAPDPDTLRMWQTSLGAPSLERDILHFKASMDAGEAQQKFDRLAAGPLGPYLASLVAAARYLPARETNPSQKARPLVYGLGSK